MGKAAAGVGLIAAPYTLGISAVVDVALGAMSGIDRHQDYASCSALCAVIPFAKPKDGTAIPKGSTENIYRWRDQQSPRKLWSINSKIAVEQGLTSEQQKQEDKFSDGPWWDYAHFDLPLHEYPSPGAKLKSDVTVAMESCPVTAVCTVMHNWATGGDRTLQAGELEIAMPFNSVPRQCIDYTALNRDQFEDVIYAQLMKERLAMTYYTNLKKANSCDGNQH